MCSIPPVPPLPPPQPPTCPENIKTSRGPNQVNRPNSPDICKWAAGYPELWDACVRNDICIDKEPFKFKYKHFESILQVGPTCGLVALSMITNGEVSADEMLSITRAESYSNNGEMFSCKDMIKLTENVMSLAEIENICYYLRNGDLSSQETVEELLDGAILLVPYDADFNHSPCLKQGHKAHWALVCGVIIIDNPEDSKLRDPENIYVLCKHGKSIHLAAWKLADLDRSNQNLWEFSPKRGDDGLLYVLPEGGVGGENGLRSQFLMFKGF